MTEENTNVPAEGTTPAATEVVTPSSQPETAPPAPEPEPTPPAPVASKAPEKKDWVGNHTVGGEVKKNGALR